MGLVARPDGEDLVSDAPPDLLPDLVAQYELEMLRAAEAYDVTCRLIASTIIERIPLEVMSRLIGHPYRWGSVVNASKHAVIAKLGAEYLEDAWEDAKQEAWSRLATHNRYQWPQRRKEPAR